VGRLLPNPFGIYDVHGNAWEWTQDLYDPNNYSLSAGAPAIDPVGSISTTPTGHRTVRGGHWFSWAYLCRAAFRSGAVPFQTHKGQGFRIGISVDAVKAAINSPVAPE
jgi:formylglycine-generating enzyme required for sulfatase activity